MAPCNLQKQSSCLLCTVVHSAPAYHQCGMTKVLRGDQVRILPRVEMESGRREEEEEGEEVSWGGRSKGERKGKAELNGWMTVFRVPYEELAVV